MQLVTGILGLALAAFYVCSPCLAVVHGIQMQSGRYEPPTNHGNGYRYNGPAHKYLPATSELTTEAVTTTGHWQPNPLHKPALLPPYEHTYSSSSSSSSINSADYNGPYNMEYYERPPGQHNLSTFQYAADNTVAAGAAAGAESSQAGGLPVGAQHDRRLGSGQRGTQLIGQALPERYQRQPFTQPMRPESSSSYLQMQSHSYELPPTYTMQMEWPGQEEHPQQAHYQQQEYHQKQEHLQKQSYQHPQHQQPQQEYPQQHAHQGYPHQEYPHQEYPQQNQHQHEQHAQQQQHQDHQQMFHYVQHDHHHQQQQQQLDYPQPGFAQEHAHMQSAYVTPPSREFLAPYY